MIQVNNVTKIYKKGESETVALNNVTFHIDVGEYVAIMGPSGSGKSTLMHILGILDRPTSGEYLIENNNIGILDKKYLATLRNKKIGFVFQSFNLLPRATAMDNVILPMVYGDVKKSDRRSRAIDLLNTVGLKHRMDHTANELSGGEMQRVAIARALAMNPEIILADEPTGNIATNQGRDIMKIFDELNSKGHTIILITHDPSIARHARRTINVRDGYILSDSFNKKNKS